MITKRAWRITLVGVTSIVAAVTRNAAKAIAYRSAQEVGYIRKWAGAVAHRAPEYDGWALTDAGKQCWGEDFIQRTIAEVPA